MGEAVRKFPTDEEIRSSSLSAMVDVLRSLPTEVLEAWLLLPASERESVLLEGLMKKF